MLQSCVAICSYEGQEDCDMYLPSDYSIQCGSSEHRAYVIVAGMFGVTFFVVAIPVGLLVYLRWSKPTVRRVQEAIVNEAQAVATDLTPMIRATSAFFEAYTIHGHAYLWGVVDLLRKLFLTSIILVITDPDSYMQIILGVAVSFFFVWLTEHTRPFVDKEDHILQQLTDFTIALNMIIGMGVRALDNEGGFSGRSPIEIESDRESIGAFLIAANVMLMMITVWQVVALRWEQISLFGNLATSWAWLRNHVTKLGERLPHCRSSSKTVKPAGLRMKGTGVHSLSMDPNALDEEISPRDALINTEYIGDDEPPPKTCDYLKILETEVDDGGTYGFDTAAALIPANSPTSTSGPSYTPTMSASSVS